MPVSSLEFICLLIVASAALPLLPSVRSRQVFLAVCNGAFLYSWLPDAGSWILLATFLGSGYLSGITLRARPNRGGFALYLCLLLAAFFVLKKYQFLGFFLPDWVMKHPVNIVGVSYMLFRQIHFVVDMMQAQIERPSLWSYLNYQLNLFSLLAGPIQRYQDFRSQWDDLRPICRDRHELLKAYLRVFLGIIKIAGLATVFLFAYSKVLREVVAIHGGTDGPRVTAVALQFAGIFYLYPLYMYANFSGYCDIVIAGASLLGIKLPENFDRPYLSRNILDFWTRWHRTLGFWIRDYLFMPLYKGVAERNPTRAPTLAFACYFFAFVVAGVWHGTTSNFLVFGLLHGVGASAAKLWEVYLVKKWGRPYLKRYMQSRVVRVAAIVATLHYVAFTMMFFPGSLGQCLRPIKVLVGAIWPL